MIEPQKWTSTLGSQSDTVTLPDEDLQFASFKKLFPALTQVPLSEGGVAPQRTDFNTLFKLLGDNIFYIQQGGVFSYSDTADYERGAFVKYNNELYLCIQDNSALNVHNPENMDYWLRVALNNELADYLPLAGGNVTGNLTVQNKNVSRSVNGVNADADGNVVIASGYPSERYIELSMGNPIPVGDGRYFYSVTYTAPENGYFCIQTDSVRNQDSEIRIDNIDREWRNPIAYIGENATSSRKMSVYAPFAKGQRCRIYAIYIEINSTHLVFCYGEN